MIHKCVATHSLKTTGIIEVFSEYRIQYSSLNISISLTTESGRLSEINVIFLVKMISFFKLILIFNLVFGFIVLSKTDSSSEEIDFKSSEIEENSDSSNSGFSILRDSVHCKSGEILTSKGKCKKVFQRN